MLVRAARVAGVGGGRGAEFARRCAACGILLATALALWCGCGTPYVVRHTVGRGETVAILAARAGVPPEEIRRLNRMEPSQDVREGASVFLPGAPLPPSPERKPTLSTGPAAARDLPPSPAPRVGPAPEPAGRPARLPAPVSPVVTERAPALPLSPSASPLPGRPAWAPVLRWPVDGEVLRGFGRSPVGENRGVDIGVPAGTAVAAAASGKVTYAGTPAQAYGPLIILDHGGEVHTVYANLRQTSVKRGDSVSAGQTVGTSGEQATTPMPHVHFEVRHKGEAVDPLLLLPPR